MAKLESASRISLYLELVKKVTAGLMIMKKIDNSAINLPFISWQLHQGECLHGFSQRVDILKSIFGPKKKEMFITLP